ncbi:MAG: metallophosphoesterase [Planctomycetota bacterium]|jgi:hypothetical protein
MPARTGARFVLMTIVAVFIAKEGRSQTVGPEDFTVAFIGDQGLGSDARAVLELIEAEGADAVVHAGDFDYDDDPQAWTAMINAVLGPSFPYFACVGNHDEGLFYGPGGYQSVLAERMQRLGIDWEGDLGVRSAHTYQGILFILTAPDIFGDGDADHAPYIRDRLAASDAIWRISSWHMLMEAMQIGGKSDQSGWGVYEESRRGGAIIATAHEHSYARTHPLTSCPDQSVATTASTFTIGRDDVTTPADEGVTFVFHSGLGGKSIRDQERCLPTEPPYGCGGEWAGIYTSDQDADYGALFGMFNHAGDPCLARFYFKAIDGTVPDEFVVRSTNGSCDCPGDLDGDGEVGRWELFSVIRSWGPCPGCPADLDLDGVVGIPDLLALLAAWGPCP